MGQLIDALLRLCCVGRHELAFSAVDMAALARGVAAELVPGDGGGPELPIGGRRNGAEATFWVRDNGIGLARARRPPALTRAAR